jgi:hypothetical protein
MPPPVVVAPELGQFQSVPVAIAPESRLVSLFDKEGLAAEKFRFLGVRLRQLQQTRPLKKLLITSNFTRRRKESGVGQPCGNPGATKAAKSPLTRRRSAPPSAFQPVRPSPHSGYYGMALRGSGPINSIYYLDSLGFWFLPAGRPPENPLELMQTGKLSSLLVQLTASFDGSLLIPLPYCLWQIPAYWHVLLMVSCW